MRINFKEKNMSKTAFILMCFLALFFNEAGAKTLHVTVGSCDACYSACFKLSAQTTCTMAQGTATEGSTVTVNASKSSPSLANESASFSASTSTVGSYACTCSY
jgi:hypothetical protein